MPHINYTIFVITDLFYGLNVISSHQPFEYELVSDEGDKL